MTMTEKRKDPCGRCDLSLLLESAAMFAALGLIIAATILPLLNG